MNPIYKTNTFTKSLSGYHMLMIIAGIDGNVSQEEEKVIRQYVKINFAFLSNLEEETAMLKNLPVEFYMPHFTKAATDFYSQSNDRERLDFIAFLFKLVKADKKISKEENIYINELYNIWGLD